MAAKKKDRRFRSEPAGKPGPKKGWKKRLAAKEARALTKLMGVTRVGPKSTAPGRPRATPAPEINVPRQIVAPLADAALIAKLEALTARVEANASCAVPAPRKCAHEPLAVDGGGVVSINRFQLGQELITLHLCGKCLGVYYTQSPLPAPAPVPTAPVPPTPSTSYVQSEDGPPTPPAAAH